MPKYNIFLEITYPVKAERIAKVTARGWADALTKAVEEVRKKEGFKGVKVEDLNVRICEVEKPKPVAPMVLVQSGLF